MTTPNLAEIDYLRQIAAELTEAGHGKKGAIAKRACTHLNISNAELYRRLETVGFSTGRKQRSDKGKTIVSVEAAEFVGGFVADRTRANGKQTTPITVALEVAKANGLVGDISAATISRVMKQNHCHPKQLALPTPHTRQRSLHPNHVWQIDASVCVVFYLPKSGMCVMDEKKFYKNKPENIKKIEKERVIRYVVTDHTSGSIYFEYVGGSENSENLTNVFLNTIQKRSLKEPMHGVPFILYADKGSANTSGLFKNLLIRLGVEFIAHEAGNPRAKGQVEQANNLIETQYEGLLRGKNIQSIEELNQDSEKWRIYWNDKHIHSRTKRTRNAVWQMIKPEQLRIAPSMELCRELVTTELKQRTVKGDLTIQHSIKGFGENFYNVRHIDGLYVGAKVDVVVNPYRAPDIDILMTNEQGQQVIYTVEPDQYDIFGQNIESPTIGKDIKSVVDTPVDQARKRLTKQAYNADTLEAAEKAKAKNSTSYQHIDHDAHINKHHINDFIPRAGEQLTTPQQRKQLAPLNLIQAAKAIRGHVGDLWTPEWMSKLKTTYSDGNFPQEDIMFWVERVNSSNKPTKLKVVGE